jgi:hypothetical protein
LVSASKHLHETFNPNQICKILRSTGISISGSYGSDFALKKLEY